MKHQNYYAILQIHHHAPQTAIKQAYRKLVKQYHPDVNHDLDNHETIARINVAYEILSNPNSRASYDLSIGVISLAKEVNGYTPTVNKSEIRKTGKTEDEKLQEWLNKVYEPICSIVTDILGQLDDQIDALADDPFDDDLMSVFLQYLEHCQTGYKHAQEIFRRLPNPIATAGVAECLFYCLNQLGDGIEEFYYFTNNYDDYHLHTGIELWRIADEMFMSAQAKMDF